MEKIDYDIDDFMDYCTVKKFEDMYHEEINDITNKIQDWSKCFN